VARIRAAFLLAALIGVLPGSGPAAAPAGDTAVLLGGGGEVYIAGLPAGWRKQAEASDALGIRADWLPAGQTVEDWRDRITLQLIPEVSGPVPERFLDNLAALWTESCESVMVTEVESKPINGYAAASRLIACTRDTQSGKGSVSLYRAIAGERALYVVQRAYRVAPFTTEGVPIGSADLDAGRNAIGYGVACARDAAAHPCPADWTPVLAPLDPARQLVVFPAPG